MQKTLILTNKRKTGKRRRMVNLKLYRSDFFFKMILKKLFAFKNCAFENCLIFCFLVFFGGKNLILTPDQKAKLFRRSCIPYMYRYSFPVDLLKKLQYYRCSFLMRDPCNRLHKFIAFLLPIIFGFKFCFMKHQSVLFT